MGKCGIRSDGFSVSQIQILTGKRSKWQRKYSLRKRGRIGFDKIWNIVRRKITILVKIIYTVSQKEPTLSLLITLTDIKRFSLFLADAHHRKCAKSGCIINPPNALCVTALPCKILFAILVLFFTAKTSLFYFGNIFVNFHSYFTIFERIIPDNYYLQVLFLLTFGTS